MESPWRESWLLRFLEETKVAPRDDLERCQRKQASLRESGERVPLGLLLVERGVIDPEELADAWQGVQAHTARCSCGSPVFRPPSASGRTVPCPECGREVSTADEDEPTIPPTGSGRPVVRPGSSESVESGGTEEAPTRPAPGGFASGSSPERIGPYRLEEELGEGAMGIVYRARHEDIPGRVVALKLLRQSRVDEYHKNRFQREAEALATLDHPAIVRVHEAREHDGRFYFTMDLVEGRDLSAIVGTEPTEDLDRVLPIYRRVVEAVAHAHERGVVHRDLKLANVIVRDDGEVRLTDFGLSRILDRETRLTLTGDILGTPVYMAPELIAGQARSADERCDVYALGVMLYRMLTGEYPHVGEGAQEVFVRAMEDRPRFPEPADRWPRPLRRICLQAIEKVPADRYPDASVMARDLDRFIEGREVKARPVPPLKRFARQVAGRPLLVLVVLAVLGSAGAGALLWTQRETGSDPETVAREAAVEEARAELDGLLENVRRHEAAAREAVDGGDVQRAVDAVQLARSALETARTVTGAEGLPPETRRDLRAELAAPDRYRGLLTLLDPVLPEASRDRPGDLLDLCEAARAVLGRDPVLALRTVRILRHAGDHEAALDRLGVLLQGDLPPDRAAVLHLERGLALAAADRGERALAEVRRAVELEAGPRAGTFLARLLVDRAGRRRAELLRLVRRDEIEPAALDRRLVDLRLDVREAAQAVRRAIDRDETADRRHLEGRIHLAAGRPGQALRALSRSVSLGESDWRTRRRMGEAAELLGEAEDAAGYYREALREADGSTATDRERALLHHALGRVAEARLDHREAREEYTRALQVDPTLAEARGRAVEVAVLSRTMPNPRAADRYLPESIIADPPVAVRRAEAWCRAMMLPPHRLLMGMMPRRLRAMTGELPGMIEEILEASPGDPEALVMRAYRQEVGERGEDPDALYARAHRTVRAETSPAELFYRRAREVAATIPARVDRSEIQRRAGEGVGLVGLFDPRTMGEEARRALERAEFLARRAIVASNAHPLAPILAARLRLLYWSDRDQAFRDYARVLRCDRERGVAYAFLLPSIAENPRYRWLDSPMVEMGIRESARDAHEVVLPEDRRLVYVFRAQARLEAVRRSGGEPLRSDWRHAAENYANLAGELGLRGLDAYHRMVAHREAAEAYERAGDREEMARHRRLRSYRGLLRLSGEADDHLEAARAALEAGNLEEARSRADRAHAIDRSLGEARFVCGLAFVRDGDLARGLEDLAAGAAAAPAALRLLEEPLVEWEGLAARLVEAAGDAVGEGSLLFLRWLAAEVDGARSVRRLEEGLLAGDRHLADHPRSPGAYVLRGRLHELAEHSDEALRDYRLALLLKPDDPVAATRLVRLLEERGGAEHRAEAARLRERFGGLPDTR